MCGIIGYCGKEDAVEKLLYGLKALEYRGYDSAGIAVFDGDEVISVKSEGRIGNTEALCKEKGLQGFCGIGHTRWATHGEVSVRNAHPHTKGRTTIVHNGIAENYNELNRKLKERYDLISDTDTEIVCALIDSIYSEIEDPIEALEIAKERINGSYAIAVIFSDIVDTVYGICQDSPLIVSEDENGMYLASDITAIDSTDKLYYRVTNEVAVLCRDKLQFYRKGEKVIPESFNADRNMRKCEKDGFSHFMLKEIHEEPDVIKRTLDRYVIDGIIRFPFEDILTSFRSIRIIACGTALHAGMTGAYLIEKMAGIPCRYEVASEFRYNAPEDMSGELAVIISQSGETADSLAALRIAKELSAVALGIVNVENSSVARESDIVLYTSAGAEIAVASTKAYTAQLAIIYLLAFKLAYKKRRLSLNEQRDLCDCLYREIPDAIREVIEIKEQIEKTAKKYAVCENAFYIGRGMDHLLCEEASLKLKEISYIHSEAYAAGELKHGTISLITEKTPVIALLTDPFVFSKTVSNIREVKARGAEVLVIGMSKAEECEYDALISLPETDPLFAPFTAAVAFQLFAYYVALHRGCDIDKPRNLAKSVTVE